MKPTKNCVYQINESYELYRRKEPLSKEEIPNKSAFLFIQII